MVSNRNLLFQGSTFRGYVSFREGTGQSNTSLGCHKWFRFAVIHICESILFLVGDMLVPWNFICNVWNMCFFPRSQISINIPLLNITDGYQGSNPFPIFLQHPYGCTPENERMSPKFMDYFNRKLPSSNQPLEFSGDIRVCFPGRWSSVSSQTWGDFNMEKLGKNPEKRDWCENNMPDVLKKPGMNRHENYDD